MYSYCVVVAFCPTPGFSPILNMHQKQGKKQVKMRVGREEKQEGRREQKGRGTARKRERKTATPQRGKSHIKRSKDERIHQDWRE